jgi:hypothetical protein
MSVIGPAWATAEATPSITMIADIFTPTPFRNAVWSIHATGLA